MALARISSSSSSIRVLPDEIEKKSLDKNARMASAGDQKLSPSVGSGLEGPVSGLPPAGAGCGFGSKEEGFLLLFIVTLT